MSLQNVMVQNKWTDYISMIDASSDPVDFFISLESIPYKKFNRIRSIAKLKKQQYKKPVSEYASMT